MADLSLPSNVIGTMLDIVDAKGIERGESAPIISSIEHSKDVQDELRFTDTANLGYDPHALYGAISNASYSQSGASARQVSEALSSAEAHMAIAGAVNVANDPEASKRAILERLGLA